jgi:NADP-dependent 3-hydroxy acid dehydrogenase YdfG
MAGNLKGRSVLVTGASAGIGRATALALAGAGADVLLTGRRQVELDEVAAACAQAGGAGRVLRGDVTDQGFVRELGQAAKGIDILVNNAGILTYAPILDAQVEDCEAMFQANVVAAFAVAREIARDMVERKRGHMVFMTSLSARNVNAMAASYAATKHALSAYAKGFRVELKSFGIKVTEIAPGMVDTHIRDNSTHPDVLKSVAARKFPPLTPEDVAAAVLYAVSTRDGCCPDLIELRPTVN